jgi:hypothetical protein
MGLGSLLKAFKRQRPDAATIERVKGWTRAALHPGEGTVAVNEIVCADPACPGYETVVLIMAPGQKTRAVKVQKPVEEVTEQDIRDALV